MNKLLAVVLLAGISACVSATIGPLPIYLNTEYRATDAKIDSIASVQSYSSLDIEESGANTFAEFLTTIPSIEATNPPGNIPSVFIRGNEGAHTLLLVDGVKVANGGYANLDAVPLDAIEKIEILKGPFSSLYGPGAIGGVIAITTKKKSQQSSAHVSIGTHNTNKISINTSASRNNEYINLSLSEYNTDGINATTSDTSGEKDSIHKKTISINAGAALSPRTTIQASLLNSRSEINFDGFGSANPDNNLSQLVVKTSHEFSDVLHSSIEIRKQNATKQAANFELSGYAVVNEYTLDTAQIVFGLEQESDKAITDNRLIKHQDIFAQYQSRINANDIVLGIRNIDHKKFDSHLTYNVGWGSDIYEDIRLNATYGKATNLPSHFQNNLNITTNQTTLKPEHNTSFELGIDYNKLSLTLYSNKTKNAFSYFDPDGVFSGDEYYINKGGINNKGIEIDYAFTLPHWLIQSSVHIGKSIDQDTQLEQGRRPNRSISITALNTYKNFSNKVQLIGKSRTWDTDSHLTGENGGYVLLHLGTTYHYSDNSKVTVQLQNATDKQYEIAKGYNQFGRTFELGFSYNF